MEEYEQIGRPMHSEQLVRSRFNESLNNGQFDDCYDTLPIIFIAHLRSGICRLKTISSLAELSVYYAYSNEQKAEDTIIFETAWSNPEPVMLKLSEMYPEATIEHWWADEDMGSNDGYRVYRGGEIVDGDYHDSYSKNTALQSSTLIPVFAFLYAFTFSF